MLTLRSLTGARSPLGLHPTVLLVASVHFIVDGYGNIYAPLLPLLIPRLGLTLTAAGTLTMLFQLATSVAQVGFGRLADNWRPRLLLVSGPIVAVALLSFIGLSQSSAMLAFILVAGGLGGAAFHPPAAALVHRLGGNRRGFAMSFHITGGTLGFSLGPLLFAPFAQRFGLHWTPVLAIPGLLIVAALLPRVPPIAIHPSSSAGFATLRPYARPLGLLYAIVVLRTMTSLSFATFVPVMLTRRGFSVGQAGTAVAIYLFGTGVGGFFGGPAADRFGARKVIALSLILAAPFLFVSTFRSGWTLVGLLAIGGLFLQSTLPVNVTFGQSLAPVSAATVSSLMMGFAWGTGGLTVPAVGWVADHIGIERTLAALALIPLVAAACAIPLPARPRIGAPIVPSDAVLPEAGR